MTPYRELSPPMSQPYREPAQLAEQPKREPAIVRIGLIALALAPVAIIISLIVFKRSVFGWGDGLFAFVLMMNYVIVFMATVATCDQPRGRPTLRDIYAIIIITWAPLTAIVALGYGISRVGLQLMQWIKNGDEQ